MQSHHCGYRDSGLPCSFDRVQTNATRVKIAANDPDVSFLLEACSQRDRVRMVGVREGRETETETETETESPSWGWECDCSQRDRE